MVASGDSANFLLCQSTCASCKSPPFLQPALRTFFRTPGTPGTPGTPTGASQAGQAGLGSLEGAYVTLTPCRDRRLWRKDIIGNREESSQSYIWSLDGWNEAKKFALQFPYSLLIN